MITRPTTLGVIVGNRGFFPSHLCSTGRTDILDALERGGLSAVALSAEATPCGSVETLTDARACADLFRSHRDEIDGVLVTLPNFGDERAVANTLRWAGLDVPVLVHAFADDCTRMSIEQRRDSFCGKMSVCNNLRQYGIPYSLTTLHTVAPSNASFGEDLRRFATTCRVTRSLKHARRIASYVGEGRFTDDVLDTFGGYGVVEVRDFQRLLQTICRRGFEHHIAATRATVADAIGEALETYMGWNVYRHQ